MCGRCEKEHQKRRRSGDSARSLSLVGSYVVPQTSLIRLSASLFSGTLSRHSLLQSALLARLQVVGVTPHFLNDVFRLSLAFEPTKGVLQRLALLQSNFCQTHPPKPTLNRHIRGYP